PKEYRDKGKIKVIGAGRKSPYSSSHTNYTESTITISSSGAYAGYVWIHDYPIWASDCTVIRVNEKIDIQYLYLFLKSKQSLIYSFQSGAGQPHVYWKNVKNIEINLPTLTKQKEIASVLDKVQELISLRKESIKKLDELSKSIFIDMFGEPFNNPHQFEIKELAKITDKITDGTHKTPLYTEKGIVFLSAKNVKNETLNFDNCKYISKEEHIQLIKRCNPEYQDILLTKSGSTGMSTLVPKIDFEFSLFESLSLIKFNKNILNPYYLKSLLNSESTKFQYSKFIKGVAIKHLHLTDIRKLKVLYPTIELQNKYAIIIEKIEEQKSLYEEELEKLEENFKALLQKSFN
ncbi:restriction endonuclease subunit S, partial [Poseidonibacter sp.]|uniref:restriction endonuclease subunit S n=1 Tax=Poseidonibacter sp. TaxID=2321188 RepID=UPI003C72087F